MDRVTLSVPIDTPAADGATEIVFLRRMNAGDLVAAGFSMKLTATEPELSAEQVNLIASRCTGLPAAVINKLDACDWLEVYAIVAGFFAPPQNGGND